MIKTVATAALLACNLVAGAAAAEPAACRRAVAEMAGCPLFAAAFASPDAAFRLVGSEPDSVWRLCGAAHGLDRLFGFVSETMSALHRFERLPARDCPETGGSLTLATRSALEHDGAQSGEITANGDCEIAIHARSGGPGLVHARWGADAEGALCQLRAVSIFVGLPHLIPEGAPSDPRALAGYTATIGQGIAFYGRHVPRPVPDGFDLNRLVARMSDADACTVASLRARICPAPLARGPSPTNAPILAAMARAR